MLVAAAWQAGNFVMQLQLDKAAEEAEAAAATGTEAVPEPDAATTGALQLEVASNDAAAADVKAPPAAIAAQTAEQQVADSKDDDPELLHETTSEAGNEPIPG